MRLAFLHSPEQWTTRFGDGSRAVLSIGNFDGVHLGHQKILRMVLEQARAIAQPSAVVTFDPHPLRVLRPEQAPRLIQTLAQRLAGFDQMGLDAALVMYFDRTLSMLSPREFIQRILIDRLHVASVFVGSNFCFGHRGAGNVSMLAEFGEEHGFKVTIVPPVEVDGRVVSSTAIRVAVAEGNVAGAASLLGRPFSLSGTIHPGAGRGRTILFPTLNLVPEQELMPKNGVYATESVVGGSVYRSATNVGTRPTFNGQGVTVESHLLGFDEQITGGPMEVRFHERLRDEQKFSGADQLKAQIASDVATAQEFFWRHDIPADSPRN
jgi:riboflavin kinase/FMN adenylyltransferase